MRLLLRRRIARLKRTRTITTSIISNDGPQTSTSKSQNTTQFTPPVSDVWANCSKLVWESENRETDGYKEEIDTLLTFAGLFSAVVSVFNVDYYTSLTPNTPDPTRLILTHISAQLSSLAISPGYINSTVPAFSNDLASTLLPSPSRSTMIISVLWFSALMLSLAAASMGILIKQWLIHHVGRTTDTSVQKIILWYSRHRGLVQWRVPDIIALLPVLLQISLALFLTGLVIRLWALNVQVAYVLAAQLAFLMAFLIFTTVVPTFYSTCPYKSPQALWTCWTIRYILIVLHSCIHRLPLYPKIILSRPRNFNFSILDQWYSFLDQWYSFLDRTTYGWNVFSKKTCPQTARSLISVLASVRSAALTSWYDIEEQPLRDVSWFSQLPQVVVDIDAIYKEDSFFVGVVCPQLKPERFEHDSISRYYRLCKTILGHRGCWPRNEVEVEELIPSLQVLSPQILVAIQGILCDMFSSIVKSDRIKSERDTLVRAYYVLQHTIQIMPEGQEKQVVGTRIRDTMKNRKLPDNRSYIQLLMTILARMSALQLPFTCANATDDVRELIDNLDSIKDARLFIDVCIKFLDLATSLLANSKDQHSEDAKVSTKQVIREQIGNVMVKIPRYLAASHWEVELSVPSTKQRLHRLVLHLERYLKKWPSNNEIEIQGVLAFSEFATDHLDEQWRTKISEMLSRSDAPVILNDSQ